MQISFDRHSGMPKLAWIAKVETQASKFSATLGEWVEIQADSFIEGVADIEFSSNALDQTAYVFGSGAVIRGETVTFVSSMATTDYLYWRAADDGRVVHVSNSLPLLLAYLNDRLDPGCLDYSAINHSIMFGINRYQKRIPTSKGTVNRLIHRNLQVGPAGVMETDKPIAPRFSAYSDYLRYLTSSYGRIAQNARDVKRQRPMAIFSTQSRGYDSSAINAVAKDFGVDCAFTVSRGKALGMLATQDRKFEVNDDGTQICEKFAIPCVQIERRALEGDSEHESLYYAALDDNGDFNLQQIGSHVTQPTALLTGALGELWYPASYSANRQSVNADLVRGDLSTHGLTEVRLEAGFVQLAMPFIGATSREDIVRITESAEMDPWRLGTTYDRPIPRRIAEEAGLAREMFGQVKMASVLEYPAPRLPLNTELRRLFFSFLVDNGLLAHWQIPLFPLILKWNTIMGTTSTKVHAWNYYLQRAVSRLIGRPFTFPLLWQRLNGSIFCFCVNRRVDELRQRLKLP